MGAVALLLTGCEDTAPKKGADAKASSVPSASAPASPSASAQPVMPAVVGLKFAAAETEVKKVVTTKVETRAAYTGVTLPADRSQWDVCFQTPAAGSEVAATSTVELSIVAPGTPCPDKAGATLRPSKAPTAPTAAPKTAKPTPTPTKTGSTGTGGSTGGTTGTTGGGGGTYYKNCDAAKAAGAAPIRRGQPGYRDALDRDKDGIACDK
ncbi:excalibur calcium-binding domain-containing protein [Streptomyces sp. DK15]|uniref:excalibur calcium-binding domain-containing protein n=1 Tax=Streptomyces sp. DK15 TaxID=2957499 RepID=UPI0029B669B9|nr:excalibur calcium-binding domain-containing protein [Streptomyces sp. DK15]MDX2394719.1 excalibur calcium-binding domain-containing protein [Streptomyces sp. DK15]